MRAYAPERTGQGLQAGPRTRNAGVFAFGGILAALGASSCCVLPFLLFTVGVSGAWISNLTALAPYQPLFVLAAVGLLGAGFVRVYRRPKGACEDGSYCASPKSSQLAKVGLWVATGLVIVAATFPYLAPVFFQL